MVIVRSSAKGFPVIFLDAVQVILDMILVLLEIIRMIRESKKH
ncbi:hypothetical protein OfM1_03660 [Lactovum odontotermitis]